MSNFPKLIPKYPLGSDLVVIDTVYRYGRRDEETGSYSKDFMTILYKDNITKQKGITFIEEPEYFYYVLKDEVETPSYRKFFETKDHLKQVICKYNSLTKSIAQSIGELDYYNKQIKIDRRATNAYFQQNTRVFESDIPITDFYRMRFAEQYKNTETPITRAYLDIEVDNKLSDTPFPTDGNCPINAVSYLDHDKKELTTFLLNQSDINPLIQPFIDSFDNDSFNQEFMKLLTDTLGGQDKVEYYQLQNLKTRVLMYDDELVMLNDLFGYINHEQPDFVLAWNMAFDIPFIIDRIKRLGVDPKEIICPQNIPAKYKRCSYNIDQRAVATEFAEKGDYADITSYSVYLDQLIQFASRRKGRAKFRSYSLDSIGDEVAGVRKLDYHDIAANIQDLPYNDYRTFVKYNMMDVIVQYCIEFKSEDIPYIFNKALLNGTQYRKVHRQTVYLTNRASIMFKGFGDFVLGNNNNKYKDHSNVKSYEGAFVAEPTKVADSIKDNINGRPIMRASNAVDFDFTRLYPSIQQEYNMAPNTLIGYIQIPSTIYENENAINNPMYTRSGQFIEDLTSDNPLECMHRWFHLANFKEMYGDILEYFNTVEIPFYPVKNEILPYDPQYHTNNQRPLVNAMRIGEMSHSIDGMVILDHPNLSEEQKNELDIKFKRRLV